MLLNVRSDSHFQAYLDKTEQKLFVQMQPLLRAAINIQISTNSIRAGDYVVERGGPMLLRHYRRVYREQFRAVSLQTVTKAAAGEGVTAFLAAQLRNLERRAATHIRTIAESLVAAVVQMILDRVAVGDSNQTIARDIRRLAPEVSKQHAATIARTETHSSALEAIDASIRDQAIEVRTKKWHANLDKRVREEHAGAHEQTKPLDEPFEVGGELLKFPGDQSLGAGPGNVINCRCACLYSTD